MGGHVRVSDRPARPGMDRSMARARDGRAAVAVQIVRRVERRFSMVTCRRLEPNLPRVMTGDEVELPYGGGARVRMFFFLPVWIGSSRCTRISRSCLVFSFGGWRLITKHFMKMFD